MSTLIIVQARLGSSRFPKKILEPLYGSTVLELVLKKCLEVKENVFTKKFCCEDDIQLFQNHEPQKIDQENFLKITIIENVFFRDSDFKTLKSNLLSKAYLFNSLSPPTKTCKLFLKNNSFIFYG